MDDCILHSGCRDKNGYGRVFRDHGRVRLAHRWAWEQVNGPIPEGLQVLHRCDNPPCVNVDHLFLGDRFDNMQDASDKGRWWKTHCHRGHPLTAENTYKTKTGRECKTCRNTVYRKAAM